MPQWFCRVVSLFSTLMSSQQGCFMSPDVGGWGGTITKLFSLECSENNYVDQSFDVVFL